ncbi:hypothetical protein [Allosalinactinospora lopnorensis]|uniref:hypothetical protein n=1 Tax=Allosalinactinospora lopnorensis TaxID=1352348 RepID=UPI000623F5B8|nr:hypothetical protein [Allosalinactinospora lopnorensis]
MTDGTTASATSDPASFTGVRTCWDTITAWFAQVSEIPHHTEEFTHRYGAFDEAAEITAFTSALSSVRQVAARMSGPADLKNHIVHDGNYLLGKRSPKETFGALVWFAGQVGSAAGAMLDTLDHLPALVDGTTPAERITQVREILVGQGGLTATAAKITGEGPALRAQVQQDRADLFAQVQALESTKLINEANQTIGELTAVNRDLQQRLASGKGGGLLPQKKLTPAEKQEITSKISHNQEIIQHKQRFTADLRDFFIAADRVVPALLEVERRVREIEHAFNSVSATFGMVTELGPDSMLADPAKVRTAIGYPEWPKRWQALKANAEQFVQASMATSDP